MSTIKVTNIQDTSGGYSSTSEQIAQGRAKAWVNFNGTGTVAIRDDFNVSSITDEGTGYYTINFTYARPSTNYAVVGSAGLDNSGNGWSSVYYNTQGSSPWKSSPTTTAVKITLSHTGQGTNLDDAEHISVSVFGD